MIRRFFIGLAAAAVLFLSPLYQLLAGPLILGSPLTTHANAIVVLGGGVDKEGHPGESTVERVLYGTALYKEGFAPVVVLSTGKTLRFSEARVMRELALSLGVPEGDLLLEEDSRNTYENILYVGRLSRRKGWKRAIIVSSPYHMRRVALLYRKNHLEMSPMYAPVRPSVFYEPGPPVHRFRQSLALYREYAALAWYWLRGRI